jgi:hypothetical protein
VTFTNEADTWYKALSPEDTTRIDASIDELRQRGPALGRPHVDSIKGSRHHNMKELRSMGGHLRALFAFDRHRRAVILVGGDKTNNWKGWYRRHVPRADRLLDQHHRGEGGGWSETGRKPDGPSR